MTSDGLSEPEATEQAGPDLTDLLSQKRSFRSDQRTPPSPPAGRDHHAPSFPDMTPWSWST